MSPHSPTRRPPPRLSSTTSAASRRATRSSTRSIRRAVIDGRRPLPGVGMVIRRVIVGRCRGRRRGRGADRGTGHRRTGCSGAVAISRGRDGRPAVMVPAAIVAPVIPIGAAAIVAAVISARGAAPTGPATVPAGAPGDRAAARAGRAKRSVVGSAAKATVIGPPSEGVRRGRYGQHHPESEDHQSFHYLVPFFLPAGGAAAATGFNSTCVAPAGG